MNVQYIKNREVLALFISIATCIIDSENVLKSIYDKADAFISERYPTVIILREHARHYRLFTQQRISNMVNANVPNINNNINFR